MELHQRLRQARILAGYRKQKDAAAAMKIKAATYNGHENGSRKFDVETAREYADFFGVRLEWLLTEEGPVEKGELRRIPIEEWDPAEGAPEEIATVGAYTVAANYRSQLSGGRPEIDVRPGAGHGMIGNLEVVGLASAGSVTGHQVIDEWVLPAAFFRHELRARQNTSIFMAVVGDSMAPTFQPGDRLVVDTSQNTLTADAIYVFDDGDGEPRVKRLAKVLFSNPPQVQIISDNPSHPLQTAARDAVRIIGRVVGRISRM